MELVRIDEDQLSLRLSEKQLRVVMECLREPFAYLHPESIRSRIGVSPEELSGIGKDLFALLEREGIDL
jgi:hypothetical protein